MYRATAEIVSGTRVYADGKWLQCIGNKIVSVGERIWTDGRCVYGHLQESEQPKIITAAPDDEGIPIIADDKLYTFQKNKLKQVAEIRQENGKLNLYNYVAGEFKLVGEMPNTDKWTSYSLMINDFRKTTFLYDEGTHYKAKFYNPTGSNDDDENHFYTDAKLIASNIDKVGNRFDMVVCFKSKFESYDSWYNSTGGKNVYATAVKILRNGETVKTIPLQPMIDDVESACPDTDRLWELVQGGVLPEYAEVVATWAPNGFNAFGSTIRSNLGVTVSTEFPRAFIEDEQTWCFWFTAECSKFTEFNEDFWGIHLSEDAAWEQKSGLSTTYLYRHYLVTATGELVVWEGRFNKYAEIIDPDSLLDFGYSAEFSLSKTERITIPLQDGYKCEAYDFFSLNDIYGFTYSDSPTAVDPDVPPIDSDASVCAFMTFYTPQNKELFTGVFPLYAYCLICKISGGHLFYVSDSMKNLDLFEADFDSYKGVTVIDSGLHFVKNGKCAPIAPQIHGTINQRLRPIKKIRGWQNRLKSIEIEQSEI